jgi:hypothetical protein
VSGLAQRADTFRALRAEIEASIMPLARSVDGRRFSLQAGLNGLALRLGARRPRRCGRGSTPPRLMRLNWAAGSAFTGELLGCAPPGLIGQATDFAPGEALVH